MKANEILRQAADRLWVRLMRNVALKRAPDFVVGAGNPDGAYLNRWYLTPWRNAQTRLRHEAMRNPTRWNRFIAWCINQLPNLYLHEFLRDDEDRALHDHPSWAASFILRGRYVEHIIAAGGIHHRKRYDAGHLRFLPTKHVHRIELMPLWWEIDDMDAAFEQHAVDRTKRATCWTLFLFGPLRRQWGFHCPERGWVHWTEFTAAGNPGEVGKGCD